MKSLVRPLVALLMAASPAFAGIAINVATPYTLNFDTLPLGAHGAQKTWADNSTIPGWYLHRVTTPPGENNQLAGASAAYYTSDGSVAPNTAPITHGFYSLGGAASTERALGASPTTNDPPGANNFAGGELSMVALFTNTGANPVKLNQISYNVETYRGNSTVTNDEILTLSYKVGTETAILSGLATGIAGFAPVNAAAFDAAYDATVTTQINPPGTVLRTGAPTANIIVNNGQTIALRWGNVNDGGTDAMTGIDNLSVSFSQPSCSLSATTSGVARDLNGTPGNSNDDTFSFNITVTGFQTGASTGWTSTSIPGPAVTGTYGVSKLVTGVPIASSPLNFTVADSANAACTTSVTVTAPGIDLFLTADESIVLSFTAAPLAAQSHVRTGNSTEPGFAGGTATANVQFQPPPNNTAKYFDINNAKPTFTTEAINVSNLAQFVVGIDLAAYTTSGTAFEEDDRLTVTVQTASVQAGPWTNAATILNGTLVDGVALFNQIRVSSPGIGFGAGGYPAADFPFVRFRSNAIQRGTATYARLATTGGNNSASEHLLFDNITFAAPRCAILVTSTVTRNNQGDEDPSNDTFSASARIRAELNEGSTGWLSNGQPPSGTYDPVNPVIFGPYPISSGPQTVTFTDNVDTTCTLTVTFAPPPTILVPDVIDMARNEHGTLTLNDDTIFFRITVTAQNGSSGWTSNIPVPGAPGTVYSGIYGNLYPINAEIAALPDVPLIRDRADPAASISVASLIPSPRTYVIGDFLRVGAPPELVASVEMPEEQFGYITNGWKNLTNGVITMNDASSEFILMRGVDSGLVFDESSGPAVGRVDVTAELVVIDTSPTSNFETNDTFEATLSWYYGGRNYSQNLLDAHDSNGNEILNGYTDTAAAPYNNNRLLDEFNRPAPGLQMSGLINRTIQLTGTIPAEAEFAVFSFEGYNDSLTEFYRLQNVRFIEQGANPSTDLDGDGVSNASEDIMGTDRTVATSVLRLVQNPANPAQFTFSGAGGRFYRVYVSDDAAPATHLTKWVDAGLGSMQGFGPHTVDVTAVPGTPRRFFRVHVMQNDGPWPPVVP